MYKKDTRALAEYFEVNGYVTGLDVLNEEETRQIRDRVNKMQEEIGQGNTTNSYHNKHLSEEWVMKVACHPKILSPLKAILGPNLILLDSKFICQYPVGEEKDKKASVTWHQDISFLGVEGDVVSVWLAIDDADVDNACMQVIPGTHKSGLLEHVSVSEPKQGDLSSIQAIRKDLYDTSKAVHCCLKAGQMSLHHGHLVHGNDINCSNRRRCGYIIRYVSTRARPITDPHHTRIFPMVLVCGENDTKNFATHTPEWFTKKNEQQEARLFNINIPLHEDNQSCCSKYSCLLVCCSCYSCLMSWLTISW